jgi:pSer/pThr/pTyr-binding forkhead associated (FHA) protein
MHQPSNIVPSQHMLQPSQQNGVRQSNGQSADPPAILALTPMNGTFEKKQINVPFYPEVLRIGRQTNAKTVPTPVNGFFDSKVLSRQHAEIWADKTGKIWIRDVKSSNGTFVNGHRLSLENRESEPHELRENDTLELGIDIVSEDQNTIVHHKVSAKVEHAGLYGTTPNILDLNFGDLDPASGGGLLPSPLSQPLSHLRGRSGSNASNRSGQSNFSNQLNAMQQQRQMNYWNSPISVEQVVKRLNVSYAGRILKILISAD